jgi:hypothetical protein
MNSLTKAIKVIYKILPLFARKLVIPSYKKSYSQAGEDIIIDYLTDVMHLGDNWTWLDIGTHHPRHASNTAMFYKKGKHGINVEPDPTTTKELFSDHADQ